MACGRAGAVLHLLLAAAVGTAVPAYSQVAAPATPAAVADTAVTPDTVAGTAIIARRYPPNSIASVAAAESALADIARQRKLIDAQYAREQRACAQTFFITRCTDKSKEQRHVALGTLRPIEIEANTFNRREKVIVRDRALTEKRVKAEQEAPAASRSIKVGKPEVPADAPGVESKSVPPPAGPQGQARTTPHVARPKTPRIGAAAAEQNGASFDRKARESALRQHEIAEKKAEKERERATKKAEQAAARPSGT